MEAVDIVEVLVSRRNTGGWHALELFTLQALPFTETMSLMATHCPNLKKLGIHVFVRPSDMDNLSTLRTEREQGRLFPILTSVNFGHSSFALDHSLDLALLLSAVCPNVLLITGWDEEFWYAVRRSMWTVEMVLDGRPAEDYFPVMAAPWAMDIEVEN